MRALILFAATATTFCLSACSRPSSWDLFGGQHGRYVGVGIYGPQTQWTKLAQAAQSKDPQAAQLIDDQAILVMVDSQTGELRACGDLTGYCVGMNPWKKPLTAAQTAPIILTEHVKPPEPLVVSSASLHARLQMMQPGGSSSQ
jgi:hypothetical protein